MERVRHDHAIEVIDHQIAREVGERDAERRCDTPAREVRVALAEVVQRAAVAVDGVDRRARGQQFREREGERACACTEVRPRAWLARDAVAQQADVVRVIHYACLPMSASAQASVETTIVTGPSPSSSTRMFAPKRPADTFASAPRRTPQNASKRRRPRSGGAACAKSGRRPWRTSPYRVNCGIAVQAP